MKPLAASLSAVLLTALPGRVGAQDPTGNPAGVAWQRSLGDALAVQQATGLPLLVVVNMDGEVFNDRFANTTYKDPAFVELTRGYVCVVASPDRHTERDYDALGGRIECPRFPGCTCSEHIGIEPELFRRYFQGQRNAPRHVGVAPDGKILFDRFLDQSMQTAIDAIAKHRGTRKDADLTAPADLATLFTRRDAAARRSLEQRYRLGDAKEREALLVAAGKASNEPFDLLRLALRDEEERIFGLGAKALAQCATKDSLIDLEDALARADDPEVAAALVGRLRQIGATEAGAARLATHFEPVAQTSTVAAPWSNPWRAPAFDPSDRATIEAELDRCEALLRTNPGDDEARLRLSVAQAALANILAREGGKGVEFWFEDSQRSASKVRGQALQAEANGIAAYAAYMRGDYEAAAKAATMAQTTARSDRTPDPWLAARLLETVLLITTNQVYGSPDESAQRSLRGELNRVIPTLDLLADRRAGEAAPQLGAITLLEFAGLRREARRRLEQVVKTFPADEKAHERWRTRLLVDLGAEAMRRRYARYVQDAVDAPTAEWFAGYAALVAGEQHTRDGRREVAILAYTEAIDRLGRSAAGNASFLDSANHFAVLALAGRAPLRLAQGETEGAVADLLKAAQLRPASLDESDGLQRKPRAIAGRVARELAQQGKTELAARLQPILP